jgi:hypothetical protein
MAGRERRRTAAQGGDPGRRSTLGPTQFQRIFANNKRKVLYEITGTLKFEGDELELKLKELTCSGDQEWGVKGKVKEEKERLRSVGGKIVGAVV